MHVRLTFNKKGKKKMKIINIALIAGCLVVCACDKQAEVSDASTDASVSSTASSVGVVSLPVSPPVSLDSSVVESSFTVVDAGAFLVVK